MSSRRLFQFVLFAFTLVQPILFAGTLAVAQDQVVDKPKLPPTVPKRVLVTGTVTDAETGKTPDRYKLIPGYVHARGNRFFDIRKAQEFDSAAYAIDLVPPNFAGKTKVVQILRIEADGYPAQIVEVDTSTEPVVVEIKISKSAGTTGVVQAADGSPLPDAKIVVCLTSRWTQINDNAVRFSNPNTLGLRPDSTGQFVVSDADAAHAVLAVDDTGYALVGLAELKETGKVVIRPWASLSGVYRVNGKPVGGAVMKMRFEPKLRGAPPNGNILMQYESHTDKNGRYSFPQIPAWPATIGRELILQQSSSGRMTTMAPAKHVFVGDDRGNTYDVGGSGQSIIGKLVAPKTSDVELKIPHGTGNVWLEQDAPERTGTTRYERDYHYYQWIQSDAGKEHWLSSHGSGFKIAKDGTFRVDDLPPGEYRLVCRVEQPADDDNLFGRSTDIAIYSSKVNVSAADERAVQDLGDLEVTLLGNAE